jgi:methyl-accepting chemotaxis protein
MKISDMKLRFKIGIATSLMIVIPLIIVGLTFYNSSKKEIKGLIKTQLINDANKWLLISNNNEKQIEMQTNIAIKAAKKMVTAQANVVYELIRAINNPYILKDKFSKIKVGETGYIWVVDYQGNYLVSKNRASDGKNIWNARDSKGVYFIQEAIRKAKQLNGKSFDYQIYPWKNPGETKARDKIACLIHIPKYHWVIGVSSYFDELADFTYAQNAKKKFQKDFLNVVIGKTGYLYTISMDKDNYGHLGIHPTSSGKDLSSAKHIQYMMNTKNGFVSYAQSVGKRKGEKKLAGFAYDETNNRLIVASAYEKDFFDGLNRLKNTVLIFIIVITLIAIFLMSLIMRNQVLNPIEKIREALDYFANNDFTHKMPDKDLERGDEIGDIVRSVDMARQEIKKVLNHIVVSSNKINESSKNLTNTADNLAKGAESMANQSDLLSNISGKIGANTELITSSMQQSSENIHSVSASNEELSASINEVSIASESANNNMQDVVKEVEKIRDNINSINENISELEAGINSSATAMEEMAASVGEISSNTQNANMISTEAQEKTKMTQEDILKLQKAAKKIGDIVKIINDIADQTNMLALNATIEAASAGDAGKGFAVVANEVKSLAQQTAQATENIRNEVEEIQKTTDISVESINSVIEIINNLADINNTIASAVEEQSITTNEISGTIVGVAEQGQQVAENAKTIVEYVEKVKDNTVFAQSSVSEIASNSADSTTAANEISRNSTQVVDEFKEITNNTIQINDEIQVMKGNISEITNTTHTVADISKNTNDEALTLAGLADNLKELVSKFKI